jgi:hypothetical protein
LVRAELSISPNECSLGLCCLCLVLYHRQSELVCLNWVLIWCTGGKDHRP